MTFDTEGALHPPPFERTSFCHCFSVLLSFLFFKFDIVLLFNAALMCLFNFYFWSNFTISNSPTNVIHFLDFSPRKTVIYQPYEVRVYDEFVVRDSVGVLRCQVPAFILDYITINCWIRNDGLIIRKCKLNLWLLLLHIFHLSSVQCAEQRSNRKKSSRVKAECKGF